MSRTRLLDAYFHGPEAGLARTRSNHSATRGLLILAQYVRPVKMLRKSNSKSLVMARWTSQLPSLRMLVSRNACLVSSGGRQAQALLISGLLILEIPQHNTHSCHYGRKGKTSVERGEGPVSANIPDSVPISRDQVSRYPPSTLRFSRSLPHDRRISDAGRFPYLLSIRYQISFAPF